MGDEVETPDILKPQSALQKEMSGLILLSTLSPGIKIKI
jgi:hypothetical protein